MHINEQLIYLDNAATSWPKPISVGAAMAHFLTETGANPGRSGHRMAVDAARIVYETRESVARLFNAPDPLGVIFGSNVTEALNLAIYGYLRPGDHVVTTSMEHNSMMRPLRAMEQNGLELTVVKCSAEGYLPLVDVAAAIRPNTIMLAVNHASNVVGTILPVAEIGEIARQYGLLLLVDTAQSAGAFPIDMQADQIDLLAFTGHKSLYGPMGTGGLIVGPRVDLKRFVPLKRGGTGSRSELEEHPDFLPDLGESGTPNGVGIAGLNAGIHWILQKGLDSIRSHETKLTQRLLDGLLDIPGVTVYGSLNAAFQTPTISFNIDDQAPSEIGLRLDEEFGILCRVGLHCAPAAHKTLGTFPTGTVRFSLGAMNTREDVRAAISAVRQLSHKYKMLHYSRKHFATKEQL
ncbi:MAG: aminotransferase class V-fold PLP-dependent enzyme [Anaerolineales bacterium]